jgi:hypothetical protein
MQMDQAKTRPNELSQRIIELSGVAVLSLLLSCSFSALAEDTPTFQLTARDGRFHPETIEVPAGKKFRIEIKNEGPGPEEFESLELRKETVLAEGVTRTLVFAPMKPGTYKFFGEFHMDTAKGRIVAK